MVRKNRHASSSPERVSRTPVDRHAAHRHLCFGTLRRADGRLQALKATLTRFYGGTEEERQASPDFSRTTAGCTTVQIFRKHGFGQAAVIGEARAAAGGARLTVG